MVVRNAVTDASVGERILEQLLVGDDGCEGFSTHGNYETRLSFSIAPNVGLRVQEPWTEYPVVPSYRKAVIVPTTGLVSGENILGPSCSDVRKDTLAA
jgi:hypothetical protein